MANTVFKIRRSSVAGKKPTTSDIAIGELGLNLTDRKLYSSDGSNTWEIGANLTTLNVSTNTSVNNVIFSGGVYANGGFGTSGEVLASNGTSLYWTAVSGTGTVTQVDSGNGLSGGPITTSGTLSVLANDGIISNSSGIFINANTGLVANSSGLYVTAGVNTDAQYVWANVHTFNENVVVNTATFILGTSGLSANGSLGSDGQSLISNGTATYWATAGATLNSNNTDTQNYYIGLSNASTGAWTNAVVSDTNLYFVPSNSTLTVGTATVNTTNYTGTSNNTLYVGSVTADNVVSNAQLSGNLSNYQTTAGLSANVATLTSNNSTYAYGKTENNLNVNSAVTVTTNTSTNTFTIGTASYFVSNGNFGIGNSAPTDKLSVYGGAAASFITLGASSNAYAAQIHMNRGTGKDVYIGPASDDYFDIYCSAAECNNGVRITTNNVEKLRIDTSGHLLPGADNSYNLGSATFRWANVFTGDLHLSNERTRGNDIDGTTGNWTIQEGEDFLYIINNKNGKKFKFKLEEVD